MRARFAHNFTILKFEVFFLFFLKVLKCYFLFSYSKDDDDGSNEGSDEEYRRKRGKRRRYDTEYVDKMHKKREWEKKRSKILFEYYKYTYHRCSSSMVLFDLAWKTAKDNNDLLW